MKGGTATWTIAIATAALMAAPIAGQQETAPPAQGAAPPPAAEVRQTEAGQRRLGNEHLHKAGAVLGEIRTDTQAAGVQARIEDLKRRVSALQRAHETASPDAAAAGRQEDLAAIERTLTELLGPEVTTGRLPVPQDAPVGTAGDSPAVLDETTRTNLQEARTHITAYAAAIGSADRAGEKAAAAEPAEAAAAPSPASAPPSAADATAVTSPTDPTPTPTGTSPTDTPQTPATPDPADDRTEAAAPGIPEADADKEAARRHLQAARNTLSEMTQLPEAAAITGEARIQVSQLITRFNELIAANTAWRASLEPVKESLDLLMRTEVDPGEPVGTSGAAMLDPEIRARLVEFRSHLEAFERTAGGPASPDEAEPSMPPSATTTAEPGTVATRVSETDPTTASGSTSTGSPMADMPGPTASAVGGEPMAAGDPIASEALRQIEAIEAILARHGPTHRDAAAGTSGATRESSPLDAELVSEIRTHLNELRRLVESRGRD